jgi:hypothetical protein
MDVSSGILVICATVKAICALDSWSRGFAKDLFVEAILLAVLRRKVWLAD